MANRNLGNARLAKNDEFYTQYADIEKEINAYLEYDENVFRNKTVLLPCDDPEWSDFTKYFAQNFEKLGLKKLISTGYALNSKPSELNLQLSLFEKESPNFDENKSYSNGRIFTLDRDTNHDKKINYEDIEWDYLSGDGDFRSKEVSALLKQVPLLMQNKAWLGATNFNVGMYFRVPANFVYAPTYKFEKEVNGVAVNRVPGVCWYTNIDHGRRHQPLALMTKAENKKFSKHKEVNGVGYQKYDNYDAIEVPFTDAIPSDYDGVMGVPISFLSKYSPEQFEIVGITKTWNDASGHKKKTYPPQIQVSADGEESTVGKLNDGAAIRVTEKPSSTYYRVGDRNLVQVYARILIKHRSPAK
jgi:hypothetical protein